MLENCPHPAGKGQPWPQNKRVRYPRPLKMPKERWAGILETAATGKILCKFLLHRPTGEETAVPVKMAGFKAFGNNQM